MFYQLSGTLLLTNLNSAVIDCGGVGYLLTVSGNTIGRLAGKIGQKVTLLTHLAVREDAIELFGFATEEELSAFRMLISVSGIGAKAAMSILTELSPEKFALAVAAGDTKAISRAQGVGAKTAARVVLELKDKLAREIKRDSSSALADTLPEGGTKSDDALSSLIVLGYSRGEALSALSGIDTDNLALDDIIRAALKKLMKN